MEDKNQKATEQTFGEKRIKTTFNPSGVGNVNFIKEKSAELINVLQEMKPEFHGDGEQIRLISLAQTAYEEAAMWAVKAATHGL